MTARSRWYGTAFEDRFEAGGDGCWEWLGSLYASGYGNWRHDYAHREAWRRANGPIPPAFFVCHHCDNRRCVRPSHLFVGTHRDNNDDAIRKNRVRHGSRHPRARLTEDDVRAIRRRQGSVSSVALGKEYGLSPRGIRHVWSGSTWARVVEPGQGTLGLAG